MRRMVAFLLCGSLLGSACATANASRASLPAPRTLAQDRVDPVLMAEYVRQLPVGSKVRITRADGDTIHGILMKRDSDPIVVQRRTRIPETPLEIPIRNILALELENGGSHPARTVAIGAATAVGATFGVLLLLAAIFSD
jgi:hypothetical protein